MLSENVSVQCLNFNFLNHCWKDMSLFQGWSEGVSERVQRSAIWRASSEREVGGGCRVMDGKKFWRHKGIKLKEK